MPGQDEAAPTGEELLEAAVSEINEGKPFFVGDDAEDENPAEDSTEDAEGGGGHVASSDDGADDDGTDGAGDDGTDGDVAAIARARQDGWRPKEEYTGPPGQWKDFGEFNEVGDRIASRMSSKIGTLEADNAKQTKLIEKLIKSQGAVTRQATEDAIAKLSEQRSDAIFAGDESAVNDIDGKIAEVKDANAEADDDDDGRPPMAPETVTWVEENKSWYDADVPANIPMMQYAAAMENAEVAMDPDATIGTILGRVTQRVQERFPDRFEATKAPRKAPRKPAVEGGRGTAKSNGAAANFADYPAEVREMAKFFEDSGHMSQKQYLKLLKESES